MKNEDMRERIQEVTRVSFRLPIYEVNYQGKEPCGRDPFVPPIISG